MMLGTTLVIEAICACAMDVKALPLWKMLKSQFLKASFKKKKKYPSNLWDTEITHAITGLCSKHQPSISKLNFVWKICKSFDKPSVDWMWTTFGGILLTRYALLPSLWEGRIVVYQNQVILCTFILFQLSYTVSLTGKLSLAIVIQLFHNVTEQGP